MRNCNSVGFKCWKWLCRAALIAAIVLLNACASSPHKAVVTAKSQPGKAHPWTPAQQKLYQSASSAGHSGDWQTASTALAKLTQAHPNASLWADYGLALQKQGRLNQAKKAYRKALSANSGQAMAANNLALLLRGQGQFDQARSLLETAVQANPNVASLHYNLGVLYDLYLLKPGKALEQYQAYQKLQDGPDKKVAGWIALLQREVK